MQKIVRIGPRRPQESPRAEQVAQLPDRHPAEEEERRRRRDLPREFRRRRDVVDVVEKPGRRNE
jgi:hypothetical protein